LQKLVADQKQTVDDLKKKLDAGAKEGGK